MRFLIATGVVLAIFFQMKQFKLDITPVIALQLMLFIMVVAYI